MKKKIVITQTKSIIGRLPKHKSTILSLGLKGIGKTVKLENTPSIRGMIRSVSYMLKIKDK
ncbi:50S ribosomal protein L30 [Buchnera aphidicola (Taiwanaphis decaspermi)]|uniref:50S ribosomal protein L30 n=1 Tax=Buchnera aphidicola TaxID=9 RepID=UPI0031B87563